MFDIMADISLQFLYFFVRHFKGSLSISWLGRAWRLRIVLIRFRSKDDGEGRKFSLFELIEVIAKFLHQYIYLVIL